MIKNPSKLTLNSDSKAILSILTEGLEISNPSLHLKKYILKNKEYQFKHGKHYILPDNRILVGCYHPSPRNVNTKRINQNKMNYLLRKIKKYIN